MRIQPGQSHLIYDSPTLSITMHRKPLHELAGLQLTIHTFDRTGRPVEHTINGSVTIQSLAETLTHWTTTPKET